MIKGVLLTVFWCAAGVALCAYIFGAVVPPGMIGVRQIKFGPAQGYSAEGLRPGYHWSIPLFSEIHLMSGTIQALNMHRDRQKYLESRDPLEVQTEDGSSVIVDVTLLYRFFQQSSAEHGGPADLINSLTLARANWIGSIATAATNELKIALGTLSTSQFYDPDKRQAAIDSAHKVINSRLNSLGINIEAVLLRRYTYSEQRIDNAIFQKNLQDQEGRLNTVRSKLAEAEAALAQVSAEWDAKIKTLQVEGEKKARILRSEADRYAIERQAEADLLVASAQAEVDKLKAETLASSRGAQIFIGKELAPLLSSLKGGVVSGLDPYDLDGWIERLGIGSGSADFKRPG